MSCSELAEKKALEKENQRRKKIVAELERDKSILKETVDVLHGPTTARQRAAVVHVRRKFATSERRTCRVLAIARSTLRYQTLPQNDDALRRALIRLGKQYGRYGCRKSAKLPTSSKCSIG